MRVKSKAMPLRLLGMAIFAVAVLLSVSVLPAQAALAADSDPVHITVDKDRELLDGDYILETDIHGQVVIKAGQAVTLNLNGHNITSSNKDAIVVNDGATLIVKGDGTIEAVGNSVASLYNHRGDVTLDGGTFLKDEGKGIYYSVLNQGKMTINSATIWMDNTDSSSLLANGAVRNYSDPTEYGEITINGGQFYGGVVNLKNDEGGTAVITGGHFIGGFIGTIQNWNNLTINDGVFDTLESYNGAILSVSSGDYIHPAAGITAINGGVFTGSYLLEGYQNGGVCQEPITVPVNITGGTFNVGQLANPSPMVNCGDVINESVITGGLFTDEDIELPALPDGYHGYIIKNGATLVTDEVVNFKSDEFVVDITVGDSYTLDLPQIVMDNAAIGIVNFDGVIDRQGNQVITVHPGRSIITIEFNGEVQTYVFDVANKPVEDPEAGDETPEVTQPVEDDSDETDDSGVAAPNTGSETVHIASDGVSTIATITTGIVMLLVLAGIRIAAKEND